MTIDGSLKLALGFQFPMTFESGIIKGAFPIPHLPLKLMLLGNFGKDL